MIVNLVDNVQALLEGMMAVRKQLGLPQGRGSFERLDGGADMLSEPDAFNLNPELHTPWPTKKFDKDATLLEHEYAARTFFSRCDDPDDPMMNGHIATSETSFRARKATREIDGELWTVLDLDMVVFNPRRRGKGLLDDCMTIMEGMCPWDGVCSIGTMPALHNFYSRRGYKSFDGDEYNNVDYIFIRPDKRRA